MAKDLAIVLNNGSINSAVATALAAQKYRPILLHFQTDAGSPRRRAAYERQVAHFKPYREHTLAIPLPTTPAGGVSAENRWTVPLPARLMELLPPVALALRLAADYRAAAVYLGLRVGPQADDLAQATEFVQICNELVQMPLGQMELELLAPLLELEPWQVVDVAVQAAAPLAATWSCLEDIPAPCGACRGCRARAAAFQQAAKADPLG